MSEENKSYRQSVWQIAKKRTWSNGLWRSLLPIGVGGLGGACIHFLAGGDKEAVRSVLDQLWTMTLGGAFIGKAVQFLVECLIAPYSQRNDAVADLDILRESLSRNHGDEIDGKIDHLMDFDLYQENSVDAFMNCRKRWSGKFDNNKFFHACYPSAQSINAKTAREHATPEGAADTWAKIESADQFLNMLIEIGLIQSTDEPVKSKIDLRRRDRWVKLDPPTKLLRWTGFARNVTKRIKDTQC